jgi:homoserine dehydrogenase
MMKVALIGLGSVGKGVAGVISSKDLGLTITGIADSRSGCVDPDGLDIANLLLNKSRNGCCGDRQVTAADVIKKADYDALVEVTPTNALSGEPAIGYIKTALLRKKHVVTSNKGPIALAYKELHALAQKNGVALRYEATVAGAIHIMHTLEHGLAGNEILACTGVERTCNYILTRMADEGLTHEQALMEAREMGYAEADPTYDVQESMHRSLVILANTIWGNGVRLNDVDRTHRPLTADALRLAMMRVQSA